MYEVRESTIFNAMIYMYRYKQHISYLLILLLFVSPITLRGDDIVACFNFAEKSIRIELPHNQCMQPETEDASCNHEHDEHGSSCETGHKHNDCSDIPFAIKVVRLRNNEESFTNLHPLPALLLFASIQIVTPAPPTQEVFKLRIDNPHVYVFLQSTILLC